MDASDILRIVDGLERSQKVDREAAFVAVEAALVWMATMYDGGTGQIVVHIDRTDGTANATRGGLPLALVPVNWPTTLETAAQVMAQKGREAERDRVYGEYQGRVGQIVNGIVRRVERGAVTVQLDGANAVLPRIEQVLGENFQPGQPISAKVLEVRKVGGRAYIILSRIQR